jgi:hypothetical protein
MSRRQLALPGLPRSSTPGDCVKRAKRDFSAVEFERALARNGFCQAAGGLYFADVRGDITLVLEGVYRINPIRIARRATLAMLKRSREGDGTE